MEGPQPDIPKARWVKICVGEVQRQVAVTPLPPSPVAGRLFVGSDVYVFALQLSCP